MHFVDAMVIICVVTKPRWIHPTRIISMWSLTLNLNIWTTKGIIQPPFYYLGRLCNTAHDCVHARCVVFVLCGHLILSVLSPSCGIYRPLQIPYASVKSLFADFCFLLALSWLVEQLITGELTWHWNATTTGHWWHPPHEGLLRGCSLATHTPTGMPLRRCGFWERPETPAIWIGLVPWGSF